MAKITFILAMLIIMTCVSSIKTAKPAPKPSGGNFWSLQRVDKLTTTEKQKPEKKLKAQYTMSRRTRRKKYFSQMISSCGSPIRRACGTLSRHCQLHSMISKRSIDEVTINRVKRSSQSLRLRFRKFQKKISISCKFCKKNCWKQN